jgi:hypothetical protein
VLENEKPRRLPHPKNLACDVGLGSMLAAMRFGCNAAVASKA